MPEFRRPAEVEYRAELAALLCGDEAFLDGASGSEPPGWGLSPRAEKTGP